MADDWNTKIIEEFRSNEGKVGGMFAGAPMVILHTTGAKTGKTREIPLMYLPDGKRILVFASKGGAPDNPDWYHNLLANPDVKVEVGTETFQGVATPVTGEERDTIYAKQAKDWPQFGEYERKTTRKIPVVAIERTAA